MSNVTASFDEASSLEARKDEDGNDLLSPHCEERVSCEYDSSRKKPRHEGLGDDLSENEHSKSSSINEIHKGHVHDSHGAQHDELSSNADVFENADAERGQRFDKVDVPAHAFEPVTHRSMPSLIVTQKGISDALDAEANSGTLTNLTAPPSGKQFSQGLLAFDGTAAHQSPVEHSQTSCKNSKEVPFNQTMDCMREDYSLHAHGEVPQSTAYCCSGCQAGQGCVAGPNSYLAPSYLGKPPDESVTTKCSIGRCTEEKTWAFGFSHTSVTDSPTLVGEKGQLSQFSLHGPFENHYNGLGGTNYRFSNNAAGTFVYDDSSTYNQIGSEDLKVNLEHTSFSNPAQNLTTKEGKISGSSYYTSQSVYMKNLALMLRFGSAIFSLIAFSVIVSNKEKQMAAGSTFYVKFSDYQAYNYLTAINLLTFLYSSGQLILLPQGRTSRILSSPIKWGALLYLCDQMLAFLMISSSSSAATASALSRHGLHNIWPPACSTWQLSLFCSRADVAIAMSFVSCLFIFLSTFSSGYHLSNLLAE
ncbi:hypothetical protein L7F22_047909 [Adiantum nelumboides]|nr:hypothetical protein [Adiantum nelumboides]